jgi:anti-sigma regulatory factor (Ser/Thr protein kinase)
LLKLAAQPKNIAGVREAVAARARQLGADEGTVDDLKTAVSEACNNVVLHAYPDDAPERPLEVSLRQEKNGLQLAVRDQGQGIQPRSGRAKGLRMGLLLVGAISTCFVLRSGHGRGTELTLWVPLRGDLA